MPPARTHFWLDAARGIGALVETEEYVLELVHAGIGEEQRRVARGHQRTRGDDLVALGGEEIQELLAYFLTFHVLVLCVVATGRHPACP